jgi:hypothetical protein
MLIKPLNFTRNSQTEEMSKKVGTGFSPFGTLNPKYVIELLLSDEMVFIIILVKEYVQGDYLPAIFDF